MSTIVQKTARRIAEERGIKYTEALREAENDLLLGGYERNAQIEALLPLLREIKPIHYSDSASSHIMFVQPSSWGGSGDKQHIDYLVGSPTKDSGEEKSDSSICPLVSLSFFHYDENEWMDSEEAKRFRKNYKFDKHGFPGYYGFGEGVVTVRKIADRVVVESDVDFADPTDYPTIGTKTTHKYNDGSVLIYDTPGINLDRTDFVQVVSEASSVRSPRAAFYIDVRGISLQAKIDLIAKTVNGLHSDGRKKSN